jgi:predicted RNase H-like HicB family nuclease
MASRTEYKDAAIAKAEYERMEDGRFFATIPGFDGLWAMGSTRDEAATELSDVLDGWLIVHNKIGKHDLPAVHLKNHYAKAREQWNREHIPDKHA